MKTKIMSYKIASLKFAKIKRWICVQRGYFLDKNVGLFGGNVNLLFMKNDEYKIG